MSDTKNMLKYEVYRTLYEKLNKAMSNRFFYEAIFIEYAFIEDRTAAILKYARVPFVTKTGRDIPISEKLNRIENSPEFSDRFYKERLNEDLLQKTRAWLDERNDLVHHLATIPYDHERIKKAAEEGYLLARKLQNKSRSVINHLKTVDRK